MLSIDFQRRIFSAHERNPFAVVHHGAYSYAIAYNPTCAIHTWVIRQKNTETKFHWLQPLDESIR